MSTDQEAPGLPIRHFRKMGMNSSVRIPMTLGTLFTPESALTFIANEVNMLTVRVNNFLEKLLDAC